jgi:CheY-like chemotaxis protein
LIAEPGKTVMPSEQDLWATELEYQEQDLEESLEILRLLRRATHRLLLATPQSSWNHTAHHPARGMVMPPPLTLEPRRRRSSQIQPLAQAERLSSTSLAISYGAACERIHIAENRDQPAGAPVDSAKGLRPDVVVMDLHLPRIDGVEATRLIRRDSPTTHVLVLSMYGTEEHVRPAIRAGAEGYLLKGSGLSDLVAARRIPWSSPSPGMAPHSAGAPSSHTPTR